MTAVDPLDLDRWPVNFTANHDYWGSSREDPCPCGSGRRADTCHVDPATGRWQTPSYEPLLDDAPTGFAHPSCYAGVVRDCSSKLSKEHWLSAGLLREAAEGKPLRVSGMPWQDGGEHLLTEASMGANVLCERHNRALSRLDSSVGRVFQTLRHYQSDLARQPDPHGDEFALSSGEELERWMLKLLWGGYVAKAFSQGGTPNRMRSNSYLSMLADYLFRDGSLAAGSGLHLEGQPGAEISAAAEIAIDTRVDEGGGPWDGSVEFGVVRISFTFGASAQHPDTQAVRHPQGVFLSDNLHTAQKTLALGWDGESSNPVTLTLLRGGDRG